MRLDSPKFVKVVEVLGVIFQRFMEMQSVCEAKLPKLMSMRCIYAFLVTEQSAALPTNAMQRTFVSRVADG